MADGPTILALDTASPVVSIALADATGPRACRTSAQGRSSGPLLGLLDEVMEAAGLPLAAVNGIVALRGPGSFTGLRVGLATALGLHQALALPVVAVPTLEVLAAAAAPAESVVAAVDVLRGEWVSQSFEVPPGQPPRPRDEARRRSAEEVRGQLAAHPGAVAVGFGIDAVVAGGREPPPLAPVAAAAAVAHPPSWDPRGLSRPLYFRPPPVTLPPAARVAR